MESSFCHWSPGYGTVAFPIVSLWVWTSSLNFFLILFMSVSFLLFIFPRIPFPTALGSGTATQFYPFVESFLLVCCQADPSSLGCTTRPKRPQYFGSGFGMAELPQNRSVLPLGTMRASTPARVPRASQS